MSDILAYSLADGIAKGFVVDRTLARLVSEGAERVLVDAGGDMATGGGGSDRDPWTVVVEDPFGGGRPEGLVRLAGGQSVPERGRRWSFGSASYIFENRF